MNPVVPLIALAAFALGFGSHGLLLHSGLLPCESTAYHWKRVNDYIDFMENPENYTSEPALGHRVISTQEPYDPIPHFVALASAGELEHVDLVLPQVPNSSEINRHWKQFVYQRRDTILCAVGNSEYTRYRPSGEAPLHLKLWFRTSATEDVQLLIDQLEQLAAAGGDGLSVPSQAPGS
jgi:hypothetical protein